MGMTRQELEKLVQDLRSLRMMKEELENELKAIENSIIGYMTANKLEMETTETAKITYKEQTRTTLDKEKLEKELGSLEGYEKKTSYNVLRVK